MTRNARSMFLLYPMVILLSKWWENFILTFGIDQMMIHNLVYPQPCHSLPCLYWETSWSFNLSTKKKHVPLEQEESQRSPFLLWSLYTVEGLFKKCVDSEIFLPKDIRSWFPSCKRGSSASSLKRIHYSKNNNVQKHGHLYHEKLQPFKQKSYCIYTSLFWSNC